MKRIVNLFFGKAFVVFISIAIQIAWLASLLLKLYEYYIPIAFLSEIVAFLLVLSIITNRDNPSYKLVWTVVILVFPVLGIFLYLFVGQLSTTKHQNRKFMAINKLFDCYKADDGEIITELENRNIDVMHQVQYISQYSGYGAYKNTDGKYFGDTSEAYESLISDLEAAENFIFMEYFAIEDGESFNKIFSVLEKKAEQGLDVRLIYDDLGSLGYINSKYRKRLSSGKVKVRVFNPLIPLVYLFMNNRDHRKITVIDGKISYNGGFNLCDQYFNLTNPFGKWKDAGIRLEGEAVRNHTIMFLQMWNSIKHTDKNSDYERFLKADITAKYIGNNLGNNAIVLPYSDSPLDHEKVGENVYQNIIKNAKRYVYIFTPYLIIDNETMDELCLAAKRGIDVRIVTPGIPDKKLIFMLTRSYYPQLLDAGVRIFQYAPGFIHSKCYISDDIVGVVGTINMDYRSLYLHFECGTFFYELSCLKELKADFEETFEISEEVFKTEMGRPKSVFTKLVQAILRLFAPLM